MNEKAQLKKKNEPTWNECLVSNTRRRRRRGSIIVKTLCCCVGGDFRRLWKTTQFLTHNVHNYSINSNVNRKDKKAEISLSL